MNTTHVPDPETLRATLLKQLSDGQAPDPDRLYELASAFAAIDPGILRFSVDASHISRLGMELVSRQETALAELVKNAYDADATQVDLLFSGTTDPGGSLEVFDNGLGMTRDQLVSGFMRLSTPAKIIEPLSLRFKRARAGRKGIGRFAAQRLGRRLTVVTQVSGASTATRLSINWDLFEVAADLNRIGNPVEEVPRMDRDGTRLLIENLRDGWTDQQIHRAQAHILELLQPFPLSTALAKTDEDPGFHVDFFRGDARDLTLVTEGASTYFQHALAQIEAHVDGEGHAVWRCLSAAYGIDTGEQPLAPSARDAPGSPFVALRDVHLKAYYFIGLELPKQIRAKVQKKLVEVGGVRLFRNGFRVLPYGAPYDDWLGMDLSYKRRVLLPPHANSNFLGFVQVVDPHGERFQETSSREGLVQNLAFDELRTLVHDSLVRGVLEVAGKRGKKARATGGDSAAESAGPIKILERVAADLSQLKGMDSGPSALPPEALAVITQVLGQIGLAADQSNELIQELAMVRVLASLGLTIAEFTHEVALGFEAIEADAASFVELVGEETEATRIARRLLDRVHTVNSYVDYFEETARDNVAREVKPQEVRDVIRAFRLFVEPRVARQQLRIEEDIRGVGLFTKPMHRSEWTSILVNLFTNSVKAIRRANAMGRILIRSGRSGDKVFVDFCDNGDGINATHRNRIFEAFFTTSTQSGSSDGTGMGLGLKITKDIVESAGGTIALTDPPVGFQTCFRIEVPAAEEEEIPVDAY